MIVYLFALLGLAAILTAIGFALSVDHVLRHFGVLAGRGRFQRWWAYTALLAAYGLVGVLLLDRAAIYYTPASSNEPTIRLGDYLLSDRTIYATHPPARGDVVALRVPKGDIEGIDTVYVKRIVGLPGDRIQMRHGELYIDKQLVPRRPDPENRAGRACLTTC